jgi:microcystin-dependent protein
MTIASGDTQPRSYLRNDGVLLFGPGNTFPETSLYRAGTNTLEFWVGTNLRLMQPGSSIVWNGDTNLYRTAANILITDGEFRMNTPNVKTDGNKYYFGPSYDTSLYRTGAGILKTDGVFQVGSWFAAQIGGATQTIVGDLSPFVGGSARSGIIFGSANDTNLYRTAANTLKTDGTLEVGVGVKFPDATVQTTAAVAGAAPTGTITMFGGTVAPSGWQLCDGSSLLRSSFTALFAVIGTTYGSVDGTHFTVPDMRGRVPVGVNGGGPGAVNALGLSDGVAVASRRPQHRHTAHSHGSASGRQFAVGGAGAGNLNSAGAGTYDTATDAKDGGSANAADALDAPAYLVINYMIKT